MRILFLVIALVVIGCGKTGKTSQEKHLGYFYDFKTPGTPMQWSCTSNKTFQDDCSATQPRGPNDADENWMESIWNLLKRI